MNRLNHALQLAGRGFHVFPCEPGGKRPVIADFPNRATRDPEQIERWFANSSYNIGISTTRFGDDGALVVVDIDNKGGKHGDAKIFELELDGFALPPSLEQSTPSGGRHIIYATAQPLRQGVDVLGPGLDIRARGGYIVGPGSEIDGKYYRQINGHGTVQPAPAWLVNRLGVDPVRSPRSPVPVGDVDPDRASLRAIEYLTSAPTSTEGHGGDINAYRVAAKLKDLGCDDAQALDLMLTHWNDRCAPPWSVEELEAKIAHAFRYGREPPGVAAPEAIFPKVTDDRPDDVHPVDALNLEYAFIKAGAFILQETTDAKGRFTTLRLSPNDMHAWFANKTLQVEDKAVPLSKLWMARSSRREYESVVFAPGQDVGSRWYNLWRGFRVEPSKSDSHRAVNTFRDHALTNVCRGDEALCHWLLGYFAHMVQKPGEKPLVALVFQGDKGTGKNALVERVGHLLGQHFLVADDERYLLSNFNSHLEANLFFVLDEASWAGDKRAEGKLKGLITGQQHIIERKGAEPYSVDNLTRVAIIGNEKWLIPATVDERRFAVFNVGNGRRQDRKFFEDMRVGMEQGGYACLLRYLLNYDISTVDVNAAPSTQGLIDQKHASLGPVQEWWLDCLTTGILVGSEWEGDMPPLIPTNRMRAAFEAWAKSRNIRSRLPGRNEFSRTLSELAPDMPHIKARTANTNDSTYSYKSPGIDALRQNWEAFIGGTTSWK